MRGLLNAALLPTLLGMGLFLVPEAGSASAAELQAGSVVTVTGTDGAGLRIRSAPGITSRVLTTIRDGQRLDVLAGPQMADGLEWYQVKSQAYTGWANDKYLTAVAVERTPKSVTAYASELVTPIANTPAGARTFTSKTTGYATGNPGVGTRTATGTTVRWGTVAVDPKIIPFGSHLIIEGFDGFVFTAEDRGSAIRGTAVDIFFPEPAVAGKYGTQQRRVTVIREGYGR